MIAAWESDGYDFDGMKASAEIEDVDHFLLKWERIVTQAACDTLMARVG